ncbi:mucin TcMUCII [Trypanosoma cruzi]|nr:mucin TcMUCII [Trypanosoma cruzi]
MTNTDDGNRDPKNGADEGGANQLPSSPGGPPVKSEQADPLPGLGVELVKNTDGVGQGPSVTNPETIAGDRGSTIGLGSQSSAALEKVNSESKNGNTWPQSYKSPLSPAPVTKPADVSAQATTTTTTQAPTTTTTTTTAPEAPSTTSTEAPTTTTTRAPSRLREMDGSLSSSAWVCAPLLPAVSALAYTAVG